MVTLLTAQNTRGVAAISVLEPDLVVAQLDAVLADVPPVAAKTGALGHAAVIEALAQRAPAFGFPLVVDPVMISKHGHMLLDPDAVRVLRGRLLAHAFLVTPNMPEAAALAEMEVEDVAAMERAAVKLSLLGLPHVLVKGGRLADAAVDVLCTEGELHRFSSPRIDTVHTHGTGCVYSAAITARLARGEALPAAIQGAKAFVTEAISKAPGLGAGAGPIDLFVEPPSVAGP